MQIINKIKLIFVTIIILLQFVSCKNDFVINEEWSDNPVVYGLLCSKDSVHYIRLTKSFLGNESAYQMAQISDSLYYKNAEIYIEEEGTTNKIFFTKDSTIQRDSGTFAYNKNFYFKAVAALNPNAKYKLNIVEDYKTITSETSLLKSFFVESLPVFASLYGSNGLTIKWTTQPDARFFETNVRFYFYEITSTDTTKKYVDITLPRLVTNSISGSEKLENILSGIVFQNTISKEIKNNANVLKRVVAQGSIEVTIYAGSEDLYTYMLVNQPSSGIISERPAFSNISNGLGLFSSKFVNVIGVKPPLTGRTLDTLCYGQYTKNLKFLSNQATSPLWSASGFNFP